MPSRFVFALLAAAAAIQTSQAQVVETSDKEDTTGMPRVVFFVPRSIGTSFFVGVYCDLTKVAELRSKTYFELALSPGVHVCSAEVAAKGKRADLLYGHWADAFAPTRTPDLPLEAKAGPKQWVRADFTRVKLKSVRSLTLADPAEAADEVEQKHIRPVKPEDQAIRSISRTPAGSPGK
ncbi:MAG: hypothetical protein ACLP59_03725 [Bryobacteraceae bacterium]